MADNKSLANWTGLEKGNFSRALGELRKAGLVKTAAKIQPGLYKHFIPQRFLVAQEPAKREPPADEHDQVWVVYNLLKSLIKDERMQIAITPKQISQMLGWPDWRVVLVALEGLIRNGYIYRCDGKACVYKILC